MHAAVALILLLAGAVVRGQEPPVAPPASEDVEPRIIGTTGTFTIGFAGFVDRFSSAETRFPTNYTAQFDIGRFLTPRIVVRGGLTGTGSFGGDEDEAADGFGAAAIHAFAGSFYYFTPRSIASFYAGGEYWTQLTRRAAEDRGSVVAKVGLQGAVSSRASLFVEGGYGVGLTRGDEGELLSRVIGRIGMRLKF